MKKINPVTISMDRIADAIVKATKKIPEGMSLNNYSIYVDAEYGVTELHMFYCENGSAGSVVGRVVVDL